MSVTKKAFSQTPILETPVQFIKGVGPRLGAVFASRGIHTLRDVLYFLPRNYEDRSQVIPLKSAVEGQSLSLKLTVVSTHLRPLRGKFQKLFEVRGRDSSGDYISLKWFRIFKGFEKKFEAGTPFIAQGQLKVTGHTREMIHPEIYFDLDEDVHLGRIIPVYSEIDGIPTKTLRKIQNTAIDLGVQHLEEDLPAAFREKHRLPALPIAMRAVHFPEKDVDFKNIFRSPAHLRLIYEEFFKFEYAVLKNRLQIDAEPAIRFEAIPLNESFKTWAARFPYQLTAGQRKSLDEIFNDLTSGHPMNRLLQGDVGAGKTAVAFLSALSVMDQGGQVAFMAPTEILAEQHVQNALKVFGADLNIAFLSGKTTASERREIQSRLMTGTPMMVIGTHALIEDPVEFKNLALVIIDEQHRFGVEQRKKLRKKADLSPHTLVMTATPIPRTLALTAYGDLRVSIIRERPPGRTPIKTHLVREKDRLKMNEFIRKSITAGRQAYFIYPLVNESENEEFKHLVPATKAAETLANEVFPEFKVGLLHGQMKADEKAKVMERFRQNEIQILVSTTVVEVGVDVPNATIMVIEHSERFGLSQLHQLRGRVGRGSHASTCFLMTSRPGYLPTPERLEVMCETEDGFRIAEADLELRGPGEFLGTRQSGALPFKMASLIRDQEWLEKAREDVLEMLKVDPVLQSPNFACFRKYVERQGGAQSEHLGS